MTSDERIRYIEIRRREIALSRAMIANPEDQGIWKQWFLVAGQVDDIYDGLDEVERRVLEDLDQILRDVDLAIGRLPFLRGLNGP